MGLLDFMKSVDSFKLKVGERTLAEGEMRVEDLDTSVNETINACLPENDANANLVRGYEIVQQKDAEIVSLKAAVEKAKGEATKVIELRRGGAVFELELVCDGLKNQVAKLEVGLGMLLLTPVAGRRWMIGHSACLVVMKCSESTDYHVALGKVISMAINKGIQEGL
nr:cold-regulated 47 [Tanacetum cinerariifolium]